MFITITTLTNLTVDLNVSRIDWVLEKSAAHYNVHVGGDTLSIGHETYWNKLYPLMYPSSQE